MEEDIEYELTEARSEIRRHHNDFSWIRVLLRAADVCEPTAENYRRCLDKIRGVVG